MTKEVTMQDLITRVDLGETATILGAYIHGAATGISQSRAGWLSMAAMETVLGDRIGGLDDAYEEYLVTADPDSDEQAWFAEAALSRMEAQCGLAAVLTAT